MTDSVIDIIRSERNTYRMQWGTFPTEITLAPGNAVKLIEELKKALPNHDASLLDKLILGGEKLCAEYVNKGQLNVSGARISVAVWM